MSENVKYFKFEITVTIQKIFYQLINKYFLYHPLGGKHRFLFSKYNLLDKL